MLKNRKVLKQFCANKKKTQKNAGKNSRIRKKQKSTETKKIFMSVANPGASINFSDGGGGGGGQK